MKKVMMVIMIGMVALGAVYAGTGTEELTREEKNKILVEMAVGAINEGDWELMGRLYSPRYVQHSPGGQKTRSYAAFKMGCRKVKKALPNLRYKIQDIIAEGDKVVVRLRAYDIAKPKQTGAYSVRKKFEMTEIDIFQIDGRKIVQEWCEYDVENLRKQYKVLGYGGTSPEDAAKEYMQQLDFIEQFGEALKKEMDKR